MSIGPRLQTVANFVPEGSKIADIGTDHGYLPISLYTNKKITGAIAGDINQGPLLSAKRSIANAQLEEHIATRLGSGLTILQPGEVDIAIICGMGGHLITQILQDSPEVVKELKGLILQPQQGFTKLRSHLYDIGWHIEDEALALEDHRLYQVIYARPGAAPKPEALALELGPVILTTKPPLFPNLIQEHLTKTRKALKGMNKSEAAKATTEYKSLLTYEQELEALL